MTTEWTDLPTLVSVCNAQTDGWEIEYGIGEDWRKWDGGDWRSYWKFRARPRQPKMRKVKVEAYLSEYELRWLNIAAGNKPAPHWIRIPAQDIEIEVPA